MKMFSKIICLFAAVSCAAMLSSSAAAAGKRVALVEEGSAAGAGIMEFSLLAEGTAFQLAPTETIVIGYMTSCTRETITGGSVTIGAGESAIVGGQVAREEVQCAEPRLDLTAAESQQSATIAFRPLGSNKRVYSRTPLLFGGGNTPLLVEIVDMESSKTIKKLQAETGPIDLAVEKVELQPGKTYQFKGVHNTVLVEIDPNAKAGGTPLERAVVVD
jgi:hypothetical protein